jgi:glycosyltransferase involved in cell wall biosynthesis
VALGEDPVIVRVVDYVANPGGGVRFAVEVLRALGERTAARFEIVSHGAALERYRELVSASPRTSFLDLAPSNASRTRVVFRGIPGAGPLNALLGTAQFHYQVPDAALEGAEVAWFPWLHRHRIRWSLAHRCIGSLHDVISIDFPGVLPAFQRRGERRTVREWLQSAARIAVSSRATVGRLSALFGTRPERTSVIPLSGQHVRPPPRDAPLPWPFTTGPYLLAPINLTPHKNFEALLQGVAAWGAKHPLVVTGNGTDLWNSRELRALRLRHQATRLGLVADRTLFTLGYVDDPTYYALLDAAWALVMPTLAEGGGSFPVWEALLRGVPVVCSDIPVLREMIGRVGGRVLWFEPRQPGALAARLAELERDYPLVKAGAVAQIVELHDRTWTGVADEYASLMRLPPVMPDREASR